MANTQRFFLELSYDGTNYHGWQIQPNAITIQELLDKALSTFFRQPVQTLGCGRTDTGVHAQIYFAHLDLDLTSGDYIGLLSDKIKLINSLNALLPFDISIKSFFEVEPNAHARFDAVLRSYEYRIHFAKDPFKYKYSLIMRDKPDIHLMNQAADILLEYRDFSCFSKSNTQVFTNNCVITYAKWFAVNDDIIFYISADRFLRNMVRAIVGTLLMVGRGEILPEDIRQIIDTKNRSKAGVSVPACGLHLTDVKYPYLNNYSY